MSSTEIATPHDSLEIQDDDFLIRRINPIQHVVPDENRGGRRLSSKAFSPSSEPNGGMSVDVLALMQEAGIDARAFVTNPKFTGAVKLPVNAVRSKQMQVGLDPIPDNPYHAEVWSVNGKPNRFSKSQKDALLAACSWFVAIPDVRLLQR